MDIRRIWKQKVEVTIACKIIEKQASIHFATFESKITDILNQYNIVSERLLRIERMLEKGGDVSTPKKGVAKSATSINNGTAESAKSVAVYVKSSGHELRNPQQNDGLRIEP